ncbi:MAG: radical SAM family heme chaperone HemW [Vicinamibacterales bacterium]
MLGLYIHIPFCSAICNYCNFNRGLFDGPLKDRYVRALLAEIEQAGEADRRDDSAPGTTGAVDTIYFGGGTPSLLEPDEVERIITACGQHFDLCRDPEITLEANPETVTPERLRGFLDAGVNRLSYGVQSFRDDELRRLSRLHGAARARAAVAEARDAGYRNVSLDLMMWLPGQRLSEWLESVDEAIALAPEHVSMYLLEVYPNAPLRDTMARSHWTQEPDDVAAEMYLAAMERFDEAGYEQYEISNVARPGRASRHNLKYWTDGEWIGLGCGAHSTRRGMRWKNMPSIEDFTQRISQGESTRTEVRVMPPAERLGDALFTGLRLVEGVDLEGLGNRYDVDVWQKYRRELEAFVEARILIHDGNRLRLSREGMLVAHEVMTVFV